MKFLLYSLAPLYFIEVAHIHTPGFGIIADIVFLVGALPAVVCPEVEGGLASQ